MSKNVLFEDIDDIDEDISEFYEVKSYHFIENEDLISNEEQYLQD